MTRQQKPANLPATHGERLVRVCALIVRELIEAHDQGAARSINLNAIRQRAAARYELNGVPRLVDIIAAIPESYRAKLLPRIRAKPVRYD